MNITKAELNKGKNNVFYAKNTEYGPNRIYCIKCGSPKKAPVTEQLWNSEKWQEQLRDYVGNHQHEKQTTIKTTNKK